MLYIREDCCLGEGWWLIGIICILAKKHHIRQVYNNSTNKRSYHYVSPHVRLFSIASFQISLVCFILKIVCMFRWTQWFQYILLCRFRVQYCFSFVKSFSILSFVYYWNCFSYSCCFYVKFFHRLFQRSLWKRYFSIPKKIVLFVFKYTYQLHWKWRNTYMEVFL